jgi:hypothetical protein
MNTATGSEKNTSAPEVPRPKPKRTPAKKTKPAKKAGPAKKQATKPKADRANKKAEVIALMKRAKGATLGIGRPSAFKGDETGLLRQHWHEKGGRLTGGGRRGVGG